MGEVQKSEMPRVKLGSQGLEVSNLGFGCMGLSGIYNDPVSEEAGIQIIKECFSRGITFLDTADVYGVEHSNEKLVGKALKQLPREKIQLATKFGIFGFEQTQVTVKGTPEYARACCEMGELKKLVEEGKIKYIGLSEANPDTIRRAHAVHPITALQMEYSLWTRDIEEEIIPLCRELGIGIVPYSPVGHGFFAGKAVKESLPAGSLLRDNPRFSEASIQQNKALYARIEVLAQKHGCTPAQLALAWVCHQGDDVIPIPGTTKIKNLDENAGCVRVKLTKDDLKEISDAVPMSEVSGYRTSENFFKVSWRFANTPPKDASC